MHVIYRVISSSNDPGCMWLGTVRGSVFRAQIDTPQHSSNGKAVIKVIARLYGDSSPESLDMYDSQQRHAAAMPFLQPVSAELTHALLKPSNQPSTLPGFCPGSSSHSSHSQQHPFAAGRPAPVNLSRISPFAKGRWPTSAHACTLSQSEHTQQQQNTAAGTQSAGTIPAFGRPASIAKQRLSLPATEACQLAHIGPVHHILIAKERVATHGGVRSEALVKEWSLDGALIAKHGACQRGNEMTTFSLLLIDSRFVADAFCS